MTAKTGKGASDRFRLRRLERFLALVDRVLAAKGVARILDLGGTVDYWRGLESAWGGRNLSFTIVNLGGGDRDEGPFAVREGSALAMPHYADGSFDIVHSNSVIEHVGHWREMQAMAGEVRRLAPVYYVQTPNIWFPIEPHYKLPLVHWLPEQSRLAILRGIKGRYMPVGTSYSRGMDLVQDTNLLSAAQMSELFPDARIERERFLGLSKSLIAVRDR